MAKKQTLEEIVKVEFRDCRFHADCMALMVKKLRGRDKWMNGFLAVTSSSSIAGWAIWNEYGKIWGFIIALSQVITALKPLFPYNKHVHTLNTHCYKQEALFLELEELWFKVKDKRIGEEEARQQLTHLKKRITENEFFDDDDGFEFSKEVIGEANKMTKETLSVKYNIED